MLFNSYPYVNLKINNQCKNYLHKQKKLYIILRLTSVAGWSSLAARRAHNPKVAGSNPAPATTFFLLKKCLPGKF